MRQIHQEKIRIRFAECTPKLLTRRSQPWDKADIAHLQTWSIDRMGRDELIRIVRAADLPMLQDPEASDHLGEKDVDTLRRLAYLSRLSCRNQGY